MEGDQSRASLELQFEGTNLEVTEHEYTDDPERLCS